jgi:hypothetical protein
MPERTYTTSSSKKVTVTDEGKLAIALECDVVDEESLEQVRNLLLAQRGPVSASFTSIQGELEL